METAMLLAGSVGSEPKQGTMRGTMARQAFSMLLVSSPLQFWLPAFWQQPLWRQASWPLLPWWQLAF